MSASSTARLAAALARAGVPLPDTLFVPIKDTPEAAAALLNAVRERLDRAGIEYTLHGDAHRTCLTVTDGPATYTLAHTRNGVPA